MNILPEPFSDGSETSGRSEIRDSVWEPEPGAGAIIGGVLLVLSVMVAIVAIRQSMITPGIVQIIWVLIVAVSSASAAFIALLVLRLRSLRYVIGTQGISIRRRGLEIVIPFEDIDEVVLRPRDRIELVGHERFWPGYYDAEIATSEGPWRSLATTPASRRVRIRARHGPTFAISPDRPVLFVEALERHRRSVVYSQPVVEMAVSQASSHPIDPNDVLQLPSKAVQDATSYTQPSGWIQQVAGGVSAPRAWVMFRENIVRGDRIASNVLALSLIALILLVTLTVWRADAVNTPLPIRWGSDGEPLLKVRPDGFWIFEGVWIFPVTAAAILAINAALATFAVQLSRLREARLLLSATLPVEIILILALWQGTR